jgi:Fe-S cluster assembly protein SufD
MTELLTQIPPELNAPVAATADVRGAVASYAEAFVHAFRGEEPAWLNTVRRGALQQLGDLGFPTTKDEDWHFTNPAPITSRVFLPPDADAVPAISAEQLAPYLFDGDWQTLIFVNGVFVPSLSQFDTVADQYIVTPLTRTFLSGPRAVEQHLGGLASARTNAFSALNTVFLQDGLLLHVRPNVVVERPIHIVYVTDASATGRLVSPRTLILADHHAEATVVESFVSLDEVSVAAGSAHFTNAVSEAYLSPGARIRHYKIQREGAGAFHVGSSYAYQQQDSHYESFSFAIGAALSRTNISTVLDGPGAHATLNGLYMVNGSQTVDHQTRIEHAKERCTSHEVYRGILDGTSHGVFNGKVYVRPEAQQTDGKQSNNNLLLSERAHIDTKPQLEIFADDVKCTHGATIGRLDPTSMFYMKSRGVGEEMARRLLTYAFAADVLEQITLEPVKVRLEELTFERFAGEF